MRAPISVVIPSLNAATALPACLAALVEGLQAGLIREVILSDGGSTDGTRAGRRLGAEVVSARRGAGNCGMGGRGAGRVALVLHADTVLAPVSDAGRITWRAEPKARGGSAALRSARFGATVGRGWANLRSDLGLPYGDQVVVAPRAL